MPGAVPRREPMTADPRLYIVSAAGCYRLEEVGAIIIATLVAFILFFSPHPLRIYERNAVIIRVYIV